MKNTMVTTVIVLMLCSACQQKKQTFSDQINEILFSGRDSTFIVDENGKKYLVISENKTEEIDNSINGPVTYRFSLFNGEVSYDSLGNISKTIYKDEYLRIDRRVSINDDTLQIGQQFHGTVWIDKSAYRIEVEEPISRIIEINNSDDGGDIVFNCTERGLFEFRGKIVYDSIKSFPFEYKFMVN